MGVVIEDIRISDEFTTSSTNYLLDNVGEKVTIEVDFRVEEVFVTGNDTDVDRLLFAPQPFRVNEANSKDIIYCELANAFENFREGDNIKWYNGTSHQGERTIYEKISNQAIRVHPVGGVPGDDDFYAANGNSYDTSLAVNSYIYITTLFTAVNYRYNFIGNQEVESYLNKIDGELNQLRVGGLDNTDTVTQVPLVFDSPKTNDIGSAYVVGNGTATADGGNIGQKFTVVHETIVTPFILGGDLQDLKDRFAPTYFEADECLKYITSIDAGRNINDPNFIQTVDFTFLEGNSGWFDENFNGGTTNYSIESTTYKRLDTSVIDSVELVTAEQTVEIVVKNTTDDPFVASSTEFTLNFAIVPDTETDYINNGKTIIENFYFDRAFTTNGTPVAGDNLGTDYTVIKSVDAVVNDAETMTITATLELSANAVVDLSARTDLEYFFWVSTQNHTLDREASDRVALVADIQPFFIDVTDDGLVTIENKFLRHFESDVTTEGTTTPIVRTEDDVLSYSTFYINRLGRETDDITVNNVEVELVAKKTDGSEFVLESFSQSFSGALVVNDTQYIDTTLDRVFKMPDNDQRKQIKVKRRIDLDTTDLRYYEIYYPFLMRWEYWTALSGVNSDAFDVALPNNGQNEDWQRYDTITDWDLYYRVTVNMLKNGTALAYSQETQLTTFDYNEDADWTNETIVSLDLADNPLGTLLTDTVKIKASKDYAGDTPPGLAEVEWWFHIEVYEQGGITDTRYFSSVYDWSENSWFSSVDSSNKIVKSLNGSTYSAEALLDVSGLPDTAQFKISARIYNEEALVAETCYITTEDADPIDAEDGNNLITEDCGEIAPSGKQMEDGTNKLTENDINKIIE